MTRKVTELPELPPRASDAHKGEFGRVLVLAGSPGMVGAAALCGDACLRAGAGLVTVATPEGTYPIVASKLTCCTTRPLPESPAGTLSRRAFNEIRELAEGFDAVALGPGLGRHRETTHLVHDLIKTLAQPMVIDADGLNALAEDAACLDHAPAARILTPHPGEMARLLGGSAGDVQKAREQTAARFASEHQCVLLLKGHGTVVSDGERVYINTTGNPGMASGGTGDVLTGVTAALAGQGLAPFEAAALGAYVHGLAGDLAAQSIGQVSLIASDVLAWLPGAFRRLTND